MTHTVSVCRVHGAQVENVPMKTKTGIEVAHVTLDSDTTFKVKRSRSVPLWKDMVKYLYLHTRISGSARACWTSSCGWNQILTVHMQGCRSREVEGTGPQKNLDWRGRSYQCPPKWPTPLPTNIVTPNPLHTSLPAPMYIVHICTLFVSYAVFIYYFNCISFAIRLSGRKVAIKLIDNDWLIESFCLLCTFMHMIL